jgi:hypothetical protein
MRKVLLVEDESYLERALADVQKLFRFVDRALAPGATFDLLAAMVVPAAAMESFASKFQACDLASAALGDRLFSGDDFATLSWPLSRT